MTGIARPEYRSSAVLTPRTSIKWMLAAAGLFLGSGLLQLVASLERWFVLSASWTRGDHSIEDHLFDYSYPADPWQNLGTTAQVFGVGLLLLALGILAMARAVPRRGGHVERMLTLATAVSFGLTGLHAFVSGLIGVPSPLQLLPVQMLLSLVGFVGLLVLGARWVRASWSASVSCLLLLGATLPGYFLATFQIAPMLLGYQSHDTTPFTETIVTASTAGAGILMLLAAGTAELRRRGARLSA